MVGSVVVDARIPYSENLIELVTKLQELCGEAGHDDGFTAIEGVSLFHRHRVGIQVISLPVTPDSPPNRLVFGTTVGASIAEGKASP